MNHYVEVADTLSAAVETSEREVREEKALGHLCGHLEHLIF